MRDWLATLLQVSYSSRECGSDLAGCLDKWTPLLTAVANKRGVSVSQLLNDSLLRSLQMMDDIELSNEELAVVELPSQNHKMGSSSIENKLDDHTLAHCFSFLDTKDVCTSIERISHRFLQVSRNRKQPFFEEYLDWVDLVLKKGGNIELRPFKRLFSPKLTLSKAISLRSLRRFKIDAIVFDSYWTKESDQTQEILQFTDVIKAVGKTVKSCTLQSDYDEEENDDFEWALFSEHLSNVSELSICDSACSQLWKVCHYFSKCERIDIINPMSADLSPLNNLPHLKSLKIFSYWAQSELFEELDQRGDLGLKSDSFPELSELSVHCKLLPHLRPYLTDQIEFLGLTMGDDWKWDFNCDLSGLKKVSLSSVCDSEQCRMIKTKLNFPKRIAELTIKFSGNWQVLYEWIDCVDLMMVHLNRFQRRPDTQSIPSLDAILQRWSVKYCHFELSYPIPFDLETVEMIIRHPSTIQTEFDIEVYWTGEQVKPEVDTALQRLESAVDLNSNCRFLLI